MDPIGGKTGFAHLHVHSSYSLRVGLSTPAEICAHARRVGYESVALTDIDGTYGYIEFHDAAKKHGIKPIYGAVVWHSSLVTPGLGRFPLVLIAHTPRGLGHVARLAALSTTATDSGVALSPEQLDEYGDGVIALCGGARGEVTSCLLSGDEAGARAAARRLKAAFGADACLEVQDHGHPDERKLAEGLVALAGSLGMRCVLTHEVRYVGDALRDAHALLRGIRHPAGERDFFEMAPEGVDRNLRPVAELQRLGGLYPAAFDGTVEVVERIGGDLLDEIAPAGASNDDEAAARRQLLSRCTDVFSRRYPDLTHAQLMRYQSIIKREIRMICDARLAAVFLRWHRLLSRLRGGGVFLGPATGAGVQSFCAYLLDVTTYDPYRYDPSFQPAFGAESAREIELQIPAESRTRAIDLLRAEAGGGRLAYAPAIERITPARAVRMVCGGIEIGSEELQRVLDAMGKHGGASIQALCDEVRELGDLYKRSAPVRDLLQRASLIERLPSGFIKSRRSLALGVVPLDSVFAQSVDEKTGDVFVHAARETLPWNLVCRIDVTALSAIGVLSRCRSMAADTGGRESTEERCARRLSVKDANVWHRIRKGDTLGVFLFDGETMREHRSLVDLRSIDDLTNFLALMRARGERRATAERLRTFQKGTIYSDSDPPDVFRILKRTHGFILYDEQLRDVLSALAGVAPDEAMRMLEMARAADPASLAQFRQAFMHEAVEHDVPMDSAERWFERLLYYAGRTMRRERVFADALVVYELFFVKVREPAVFYAALFNTYAGVPGRLKAYLAALGPADWMLGPDINASSVEFTVEGERVRTGLAAVPHVGRALAERIVRLRKGGYASVEAFLRTVGRKGIGRDALRALSAAGAFDGFGMPRGDVNRAIGRWLRPRARRDKARRDGQLELPFD